MTDPQMPKSCAWNTSSSFVGFRVVRPLRIPSAKRSRRYELTKHEAAVYVREDYWKLDKQRRGGQAK